MDDVPDLVDDRAFSRGAIRNTMVHALWKKIHLNASR